MMGTNDSGGSRRRSGGSVKLPFDSYFNFMGKFVVTYLS